jgi:hypothetical protein
LTLLSDDVDSLSHNEDKQSFPICESQNWKQAKVKNRRIRLASADSSFLEKFIENTKY